jgi:hypothetical protein
MKNKEVIIKKPSAMIQTSVKGLTLLQRKFINTLVHVAQKEGNQNTYKISLNALKKICNIKTESNYEVKAQVRKLHEKSIEYNIIGKDKKNSWVSTPLLGGVNIKDGTGIMEFEIPYFIKQLILNPEIYAPLDIILIAGFSCVYTIVLYEFLRDYLNSPKVPLLTIIEFRNLVGVEDSKYKLFKDMRKRVIDRAINEINSKSELFCSYNLIKEKGNRYSHIQFHVKYNKKPKEQIELIIELPQNIKDVVPGKYQINSIYNLINSYYKESLDIDFIISNIKYSKINYKKNFPHYLKKSFENDYAQVEREKTQNQEKIKNNQELMRLKKEREEEEKSNEGERLYNSLSSESLENYTTQAIFELKNSGIAEHFINKFSIRQQVIDTLLSEKEAKQAGTQEDLF